MIPMIEMAISSHRFHSPEPYVLVPRQFEFFDGGKRYIGSQDEEYIGHFKLKLLLL